MESIKVIKGVTAVKDGSVSLLPLGERQPNATKLP